MSKSNQEQANLNEIYNIFSQILLRVISEQAHQKKKRRKGNKKL